MKMKKLLALGLAMIMAFSLVGCSSSSSDDTDDEEETEEEAEDEEEEADDDEDSEGTKIFRYSVTTEPTSLDQQKGNSIGDNELIHAMQEGLVRTKDGEVCAGIAESWEVSDDGLTYTFYLREAYWSDGVQITAGDFVYGLQRLLDPETASPYAYIGEYILNGAAVEAGEMEVEELGVEAVDDLTLVITLESPTAYFLELIGTCAQYTACREDYVEEYGVEFAASAEKNVYSGPFCLVSTDGGEYVFEKNEYYWDAEDVNFDQVVVSVVADENTALSLYESGELDYVKVPTASVSLYEDEAEYYMNGNEDYLYINHESDNTVLANLNFRLALNYAIDREEYIELATDGVYTAWNCIVMPLVSGVNGTYGDEYTLTSYPLAGDSDAAVAYLEAALEEEGISSASDITIEFTTTDSETNKVIAEVIQEMWTNVLGINVEIRQVTYSEIYGTVFPNGDYEVGYGGWGPDYSDPYTYLELFKSDSPYNYSNYSNEEVDALLEASQTETDAQTRMDMLNEAEQLLLDDAANVPLQLRTQYYLLDDDVTGIIFDFTAINIDWSFGDCDPT